MIMRKKIYVLVLLSAFLLFCGKTSAQDEVTVDVHYLVISLSDGSESKFSLADNPLITFNNDTLVVSCAGDDIAVGIDGVKNYHFVVEQVTTAIERPTVQPNGDDIRPTIAFGEAKFNGLKAGTRIMVYSVEGKAITTVTATTDGQATVDLRSLPKGIYILRTPAKSFKIYNK